MRMGERRHHTHTQETCPSQVDDRRRVFFSRVILLLGAFARSNLLDWARGFLCRGLEKKKTKVKAAKCRLRAH